ncbi:MAG: glycosyltransferase [Nitrospira sp.]|nr:glycosyltransferase [Nitrospira sp.]MCP9442321.1 glycosyltransferase [Nitrospira sp.]
MRVIHTVASISYEAGGLSYSVVRLCESLLKLGLDITLAVLNDPPRPSYQPFVKAFPLGLGPRKLGRSPAMARWLAREAKTESIDLLHVHSMWMMPNVYPGIIARRHRIPLMVSPRGTLSPWAMASGSRVKRWFWPLVQRPAISAAACFHATAESEYEDIRRLGFRQSVAVIPNGIDIPEPMPRGEQPFRTLLFLSRIHPKKGLDLLLPAWQAVQDRFPSWRLVIAGPNDSHGYLEKLQNEASRLKLKRVAFIGEVKGAQKWETYFQADLFVLPTYSENFGLVVAEALAAGLPAIVSKGAPWAGLVEKQAGWWIDIGLAPLVNCLSQALGLSPGQLSEMGRRGRRWMQDEFSWESLGARMNRTYEWIVHGGKKPGWVVDE